jgi:hypothetical protein
MVLAIDHLQCLTGGVDAGLGAGDGNGAEEVILNMPPAEQEEKWSLKEDADLEISCIIYC